MNKTKERKLSEDNLKNKNAKQCYSSTKKIPKIISPLLNHRGTRRRASLDIPISLREQLESLRKFNRVDSRNNLLNEMNEPPSDSDSQNERLRDTKRIKMQNGANENASKNQNLINLNFKKSRRISSNVTSGKLHLDEQKIEDIELYGKVKENYKKIQEQLKNESLCSKRLILCKKKISIILESTIVIIIMMICTVYALFMTDIQAAFLRVDTDYILNIIHCIIFGIFIAEFLLCCFAKQNYLLSFYFFLDFLSTVSIIQDIDWIINPILGYGPAKNTASKKSLQATKALAKVSSATRATRVLRIIRIVRLVRMIKIYKNVMLSRKKKEEKKEIKTLQKLEQLMNNLDMYSDSDNDYPSTLGDSENKSYFLNIEENNNKSNNNNINNNNSNSNIGKLETDVGRNKIIYNKRISNCSGGSEIINLISEVKKVEYNNDNCNNNNDNNNTNTNNNIKNSKNNDSNNNNISNNNNHTKQNNKSSNMSEEDEDRSHNRSNKREIISVNNFEANMLGTNINFHSNLKLNVLEKKSNIREYKIDDDKSNDKLDKSEKNDSSQSNSISKKSNKNLNVNNPTSARHLNNFFMKSPRVDDDVSNNNPLSKNSSSNMGNNFIGFVQNVPNKNGDCQPRKSRKSVVQESTALNNMLEYQTARKPARRSVIQGMAGILSIPSKMSVLDSESINQRSTLNGHKESSQKKKFKKAFKRCQTHKSIKVGVSNFIKNIKKESCKNIHFEKELKKENEKTNLAENNNGNDIKIEPNLEFNDEKEIDDALKDMNYDDVEKELIKESKLSKMITNSLTKKVILLILILLIAFPFLSDDFYADDSDVTYSLMAQIISSSYDLFENQDSVLSEESLLGMSDFNFPPLNVTHITSNKVSLLYNNSNYTNDYFRYREIKTVYSEDGLVCVIYSILKETKLQGILNIIQTIFVCVMLSLFSILFENDAKDLVLQPLEIMYEIVDSVSKDPINAKNIENILADKELNEGNYNIQTNFGRKLSNEPIKYDTHNGQMGNNSITILSNSLGTNDKINKDATNYEVLVIKSAIIKISKLLAIGFGEAGGEIIKKNITSAHLNPLVKGQKKTAIFGFCDIRRFAEINLALEEKTILLVNEVAEIIHSSVDRTGGATNKNIGESFLNVWKFYNEVSIKQDGKTFIEKKDNLLEIDSANPLVAVTADQSVIAFLACILKLHKNYSILMYRENQKLLKRMPDFSLEMGFGLHIGYGIEGAVGSSYKIDASYLSPNVNISARLETATRQFGVVLLISGPLYKLLSDEMKQLCRFVDCVYVKGSQLPLDIYTIDLNLNLTPQQPDEIKILSPQAKRQIFQEEKELYLSQVHAIKNAAVFMMEDPDFIELLDTNRGDDFYNLWNEGIESYKEGDFNKAGDLFKECLEIFPDDGPAKTLLEFLESQNYKAPEDWKGVRELKRK